MSDEVDADVSSSSAMVSRLNTALTSSIMEFILHDDTVDIDVLRRSLHYQVTVDIVTLSVCLSSSLSWLVKTLMLISLF